MMNSKKMAFKDPKAGYLKKPHRKLNILFIFWSLISFIFLIFLCCVLEFRSSIGGTSQNYLDVSLINAPWHWFNELGAIGYWNWEYNLKDDTDKMTAGLSGQKVNTYSL